MNNCLLCKKRLADKKGSHIVPHFLLKRIENIEGKKDRDNELGFNIQEFHTESYFGRAVQPDKLNDVYGELSDEEIKNNKHPLVVDNTFCSYCESRFSKIESEYAKTLIKFDSKQYESGISSELGLLFWLSIIWRMSINKKSGVQLTKSESEISRRILNRCLQDKITNIDLKKMQESKDLKKISYRLFRCPNYSEENSTFLLLHPKFGNPYALIIDEYLLLLSFKNNYKDFLSKDLFGVKEEVFQAKINQNKAYENISVLNAESFKKFNSEIIITMKKIRVKWLNEFFNKLHVAMGGYGKIMPDEIRREIMEEITSEEKKLGRQHTLEDVKKSTIKVMRKYEPQQ